MIIFQGTMRPVGMDKVQSSVFWCERGCVCVCEGVRAHAQI